MREPAKAASMVTVTFAPPLDIVDHFQLFLGFHLIKLLKTAEADTVSGGAVSMLFAQDHGQSGQPFVGIAGRLPTSFH